MISVLLIKKQFDQINIFIVQQIPEQIAGISLFLFHLLDLFITQSCSYTTSSFLLSIIFLITVFFLAGNIWKLSFMPLTFYLFFVKMLVKVCLTFLAVWVHDVAERQRFHVLLPQLADVLITDYSVCRFAVATV